MNVLVAGLAAVVWQRFEAHCCRQRALNTWVALCASGVAMASGQLKGRAPMIESGRGGKGVEVVAGVAVVGELPQMRVLVTVTASREGDALEGNAGLFRLGVV